MLLLILGIPDIQYPSSGVEDIDLDSISKTVEAAKTDIAAVANEVLDEVSEIVNDLPTVSPTDQTALSDIEEPDPAPEQLALDDSRLKNGSNPTEFITESPDDIDAGSSASNISDNLSGNEQKWYSFWNPFRSEIAANGFVTQLEKVTGLDYRVVKIKTGVYEVTFAYHNDSERRTKLSQISSATGLDLPDS